MDKRIYDMINDIDLNLEDYEIEDVTNIEKYNLNRTIRKNIMFKRNRNIKAAVIIFLALCVSAIGLIQTDSGKVVFAEVVKTLGLKNYKTENISYLDPYSKSGNVIKGVVGTEDFKISLKKAVRDDNILKVYYDVNTDQSTENFTINWDMYLDDKKVEQMFLSVPEFTEDDYLGGYGPRIDLSGLQLKDKTNIKIVMYKVNLLEPENLNDNVSARFYGEKEEIGTLEFLMDNEAYNESVKTISIDKEFVLDNGDKIYFDKFSYTPVGKKLYYKKYFKEENPILKGDAAQVYVDVSDEYGNTIRGIMEGDGEENGIIRIIERKDQKQIDYAGKINAFDDNAKELTFNVYGYLLRNCDENMEAQKLGEFKIDVSQLNEN